MPHNMCNFSMLCEKKTELKVEFAKRNIKNLKVNRHQKRALSFWQWTEYDL